MPWLIAIALAADSMIPPLVDAKSPFVVKLPFVSRFISDLVVKPDRPYETPPIVPLKLLTLNELASAKLRLPALPVKVWTLLLALVNT